MTMETFILIWFLVVVAAVAWFLLSALRPFLGPVKSVDLGKMTGDASTVTSFAANFDGKNRKYLFASAAIVTLVVVGGLLLTRGVSGSGDFGRAQSACLNWFKSEPDVGGRDAFLDDTWEKDEHIVVEIGFDLEGSSYSSRLCVYDPESNKMTAPNNFTRSRWE